MFLVDTYQLTNQLVRNRTAESKKARFIHLRYPQNYVLWWIRPLFLFGRWYCTVYMLHFMARTESLMETIVLWSGALLQKRASSVLTLSLLSRCCTGDILIMILRKGDKGDLSKSIRELSWTSYQLVLSTDGVPSLCVCPPVSSPCMFKISFPHALSVWFLSTLVCSDNFFT